MNTAQLKAKCRRLRVQQEEEQEVSGELNVIPYLDVVTNVVMFLLASMTTYQLTFGNLNITAPTRSDAGGGSESEPKEELNLSVFVTEGGFTIAARGGQVDNPKTGTKPTIPTTGMTDATRGARSSELKAGKAIWCPEELQFEWDYRELSRMLAEFKYKPEAPPEHKAEKKVIVTANPGICYNVLVHTMDAVRKDKENRELFPDIILSAGVQ